jgi:hypothetical protein
MPAVAFLGIPPPLGIRDAIPTMDQIRDRLGAERVDRELAA